MKYSVVIPLKNEEGNIAELIAEIEPVMASLNAPWELLCIDDGSTDKTWEILTSLAKDKTFSRLIAFDKNYGQSCAFDAGFRLAKGRMDHHPRRRQTKRSGRHPQTPGSKRILRPHLRIAHKKKRPLA